MFSSGLTVASFIDKNWNSKTSTDLVKICKTCKPSNRTSLVIQTNYELKDCSFNLEPLEDIKKNHLSGQDLLLILSIGPGKTSVNMLWSI